MNTYIKYCPNVFVAQCDQEYHKGDTITVQTKYGKENKHIVHNLVGYAGTKEQPRFCYSITRVDGFNNQERAKQKVENLNGYADNAEKRSDEWLEKSNEGKDFLALGEPIKVGHHSEKRHRALLDRNWNRMSNAMNELDKAEAYRERTAYWESLSSKIDLSMPESIEFFAVQLKEATEYHKGLKNGTIKREHSYALTYANKKVKELKKKCTTAIKLWGDASDIEDVNKKTREEAVGKCTKKKVSLVSKYNGFFAFGRTQFKEGYAKLIASGLIEEGEKVVAIGAGLYIPSKYSEAFKKEV